MMRLMTRNKVQYQQDVTEMILFINFLYGMSLERDVFLKSPKEAIINKLWKLRTIVHELSR